MENHIVEISLVICTYNREKFLPEALASVRIQNIECHRFELIVIDNFCTDHTAEIIKTFMIQNSELNIKYFLESNKGLSYARNRGIAEANSPIISFIDDDVILPENYISEVLLFFNNNRHAVGIGGRVVPKYESGTEPLWMNNYLNGFVAKVDYGESVKKFSKGMKYPAGCNMTYIKNVLIEAKGFNNELKFRSDDKYIFRKVSQISEEIYYLPTAWLHHYIDNERLEPINFKKLFQKTGNEEKRRILSEGSKAELVFKFLEFTLKLVASIFIMFRFAFGGFYSKGKYVFLSQWYTWLGFLKKDVFVR